MKSDRVYPLICKKGSAFFRLDRTKHGILKINHNKRLQNLGMLRLRLLGRLLARVWELANIPSRECMGL